MMLSGNSHKRFEDRLVAAGVLSEAQLDLALREQKRNGTKLGQALVDLGFVAAEDLAGFLAKEAGAKTVNLNRAVIDRSAIELVPVEVARSLQALPLHLQDDTLTVALADPSNVLAVDTLRQVTGLNIDIVAAPERDIIHYLDLHYGNKDTIEESIDKVLEERSRNDAQPLEEVLGRLGNSDEDAPVIRLITQILTRAVNGGASDIHFGPEERMMRIRTRIDGVLFQDLLIPKAMQSAVTTRMKILAELDLANTLVPQDGRATILVGGREVSLRVSSLPTRFGENVVARILDPDSKTMTLPALGMSPPMQAQLREAVNSPHGVVLVTGPTGSGKSTTLYAVLQEVSTVDVSTYTLEDPIEYVLPMARQTQIREEMGLTFSSGLRALLRQDPDIILVGETRDTETAQLMVRAALTGHLVFSTLHTNDAAGAIPRLLDMGVEPYLLPTSLIALLAQRLVRSICAKCKEEVKNPEAVFEQTKVTPMPGMAMRLFKGAGCPDCKQSGYRGRQGIYELMVLDERYHEPIVRRAAASEFQRLARETGMLTMFEDGVLKATQGITTIEELLRVTRLSH
jgi:type IV pilus assembly protein PilB